MTTKRKKCFISAETYFENINEYHQFERLRIETNMNKMNLPFLLLIFLNIILILVDIFYYKAISKDNLSYYYLYLAHVSMIIVSIIWVIYYKIISKKLSYKTNKAIYAVFADCVIWWGIFMSLDLFQSTNQISSYIIIMFCYATLIYIPLIVSVIKTVIPALTMLTYIILFAKDTTSMMDNIVNIVFTVIFSILISNLMYKHFLSEFIKDIKVKKANKKIEEAEKIRTEFFANVSHELKTPLNIIYTAQQMIEVTTKNDNYRNENFIKYMQMSKQNTNRLHRLISNLIDITKIDSASFKIKEINVDIVKIVEDITLSAACYIESQGMSLTFDTDVEELVIACDPDSIERIILNLLSNAIKFTERGGDIFVDIKSTMKEVLISVKDTGIGIPKEMKEKIFERFAQVDKSTYRKKEGSGIGLSLVKSLVELQGGSINIDSEINKGSTFTVKLPIARVEESENILPQSAVDANIEKIKVEFSDIYN
ncbi:sensor histidine kinase [Clostridium disporicum]|uniref:histidine kinase n=1 Tax=Clostridium disporicum TaxID=84024 RepID=A0A173ZC86_9CLOT|nr:HAMP domain-containing sensor histidine kinase [Clostridium disporicum]CUN73280.1 integral membrane sensor signal transduction histidine kinase [Clostridium disporicum]